MAVAVVGLRLYPFLVPLVSTLPALTPPSLASLVAVVRLSLFLLVAPQGLRLASLLWFRLHSVAAPKISLRHLC